MMQEYVVGLPFSHGGSSVLLIVKNRPDWQKDKINGIGGKIEAGETPISAMVREFIEETGLLTIASHWKCACVLTDVQLSWRVYFYYSFRNRRDFYIAEYLNPTDEKLIFREVKSVLHDPQLIPNLKIIIPLALDKSGIVKPLLIDDRASMDR